MIYSVYDPAHKVYTYYQDGKGESWQPPAADHLPSGEMGVDPLVAGWPLPSGAQRIGQGLHPQGVMASTRSSALGGLLSSNEKRFGKYALFGIAGYFVWKKWFKKGRR